MYPSALGAIEPTSTCLGDVAMSDSSRAKPPTMADVVVTTTCEGAYGSISSPTSSS